MGPAIVAFPSIYAQSGWFLPTALLLVVCVLSAFSSTMLCEAMQRIPGNHNLTKRYEFATTVKHYWGDKWYVASQLLMNICLQCLNIASIIVAAQVMDELFAYCYGETIGFQYTTMEIRTTQYSDLRDMPNAISAGFIFCMIICLPFGMSSLEENMWFQWFSLVALFGSCGLFIWDYLQLPLHFEQVPVWNSGFDDQAQVLGVVIFSYAFVITVPSWVNEKAPGVSTNRSVWYSCFVGMFLKGSIGYLAAITYPNMANNSNILQVMNDSHLGGHEFHRLTRIAVYLFNFGTIVPGIPVFSILVRYNLLSGKVCSSRWAFFYSFVLPWGVSMFLYRGKGFQNLVNWTALVFEGFVNFTIPCLLYVSALRRYPSNATSSVAESISTDNEMTYLMKGKKDEDREEETVDQADVDSVPDWLLRTLCVSSSSTKKNETLESMNRKRISFGLLAAAILTGMVLFTLFMDLYFMFALGEDIVDE